MAKRILAVVVAAALAANAVLSAHGPGANADTPPGVGRCTTDPAPTHEPLVPKTLEVPIPYPAVTAVPVPGPQPAPTRTTQALPPDPCTDPCPDLTAEPPVRAALLQVRPDEHVLLLARRKAADVAAAQAAGYPDLVAPPTFAIVVSQRADAALVNDPEAGIVRVITSGGSAKARHVRAGQARVAVCQVDGARLVEDLGWHV